MNLIESDGQRALLERSEAPTSARRLAQHTLSDLLIPLSRAIDLAEGRAPGHAQRVAYIAAMVAGSLELDRSQRLAAVYAGLMHDIGVIAAGANLAGLTNDERVVFAALPLLSPEEAAFGSGEKSDLVVERILDHMRHGAQFAQDLALPTDALRGISSHHESWDGSGYPNGTSGEAIPIIGRVVALADQIESMIGQAQALVARRSLPFWLSRLSGAATDPRATQALRALGNADDFWLGLYSATLSSDLGQLCARLREPRANRLMSFAESFAHLVDGRFKFTEGVSARVAQLSVSLGRCVGLDDEHLKLLRLAAFLHDIGQLSISERIMAKPGILTVEELELLRLHPMYSRDVVAGIPGLEEVAEWIACHHERPDGRGYPDGLSGDEIPLESRILAVADAYVAITSDRPHRPRADATDAVRRLRSAGGTQLDAELVDLFLRKVVD